MTRRPGSGTRLRDVAGEALAAIGGRRARSLLTALGVALGLAAVVATIGISGSAANAVSDQFDVLTASLVRVRFPADRQLPPHPSRATVRRVDRIEGVEQASVLAAASSSPTFSRLPVGYTSDTPQKLGLLAAAPGAPQVLGARLVSGRWPDDGSERRRDHVVLLDTVAASALGLGTAIRHPVLVQVGGVPFEVLGIYEAAGSTDASVAGAVLVPYWVAEQDALPGTSFSPSEVVIRVRLGAAGVVGDQAPLALAPTDPVGPTALVPPELTTLRQGVEAQTTALFFGLSLVSLLIGGIGVSNTMLVSVLERRREIGVRRALGASRAVVAGQFLLEGGLMGLAGGAIGVVAGLDITSVVCLVKGWLVVLDGRVLIGGPVLGLVLGVGASVYPALSAARVQPVESLRSQ